MDSTTPITDDHLGHQAMFTNAPGQGFQQFFLIIPEGCCRAGGKGAGQCIQRMDDVLPDVAVFKEQLGAGNASGENQVPHRDLAEQHLGQWARFLHGAESWEPVERAAPGNRPKSCLCQSA